VNSDKTPLVETGGARGLARFSVNRRITIFMLILIVALFGVVTFFSLGLDLMPDLDFPLVTVATRYHGVAPEDIESQITRKIEEVVGTVKNVKNIYSVSQQGLSSVMVEFEWGTNVDFAGQDVRDKVALAQMFLPEDADDPLVVKFDPSEMPVLICAVTGMENTMALRDYLEDVVAPPLERLEGVAAAMTMGGLRREINVFADAAKLRAHSISIDQVIGALRRENVNVSGGEVVKAGREHLVRTIGEYRDISQIRATVVAMRGGTPIRISDVARVEDTHKEVRDYARVDGKDNVMLAIMKQSGGNTSTVAKLVKRTLDEMRKDMPPGIEFAVLLDQGDFVDKVVTQTSRDALLGGLLAVVFIFLFLGSWRPTLVIAITIPLSILATFIGMYALDYTFNLITLGGIALGVGMVVDNAVVVIENTFRHLEEGEDRESAAVSGAGEVGIAITASTLTTMAVFLPMVLIGGIAGQMSSPMALTVCLALGASLFVAITLVPAVASLIFRSGTASEYLERFERAWFSRVRATYEGLLRGALGRKWIVLGVVAVAVAGTGWGIFQLGMELMPKPDMPMTVLQVKLPVGTTLQETDRVVRKIEAYGRSMPESMHVGAMVGPSEFQGMQAAQGMGIADVNEAIVMSRLKDKADRSRSAEEIKEDIRSSLPRVKGAKITFQEMMTGMMSTSAENAPIAVRVFGPDIPTLERLAKEAAEKMKAVPGLRDITVGSEEGKPELRIILDRDRAAEQGLSVIQVASTVKTAVLGAAISKFRVGGDEWDIRVRFDEKDRDAVKKIEDIRILAPTGNQVRVGDIATISYDTGPLQIAREGQERKIAVTCDAVGRDIGGAVEEIKEKLAGLDLPRGYFIDYGGTYKDMQDTFHALGWALVAALILIYMIMAAQFESLSQPFVVMFTVPLAFIGVVAGLAISGMTLSMPAFMGLVILAGIVVNNGIVMIDYINQLRKRGMEKHEAIVQGAVTRFRPILITSITTILGILPMGLSSAEGSEMRGPMGVAIASGLIFSMFLTLFVIPIVYGLVDRLSFHAANKARVALHGEEE